MNVAFVVNHVMVATVLMNVRKLMNQKTNTMKNIHILPTDKPSRLYLNTKEYIFDNEYSLSTDECQNKYIYITNNEEIKERDWYLDTVANVLFKNDKIFLNGLGYKKIILTTDKDLIKDGVQAIDDEFLNWFVKNPSCESVEVVLNEVSYFIEDNIYKIIIPKEEIKLEDVFNNKKREGVKKLIHEVKSISKEEILANRCNAYEFIDFYKQETLEEAFDRIFDSIDYILFDFTSFEQGAKWQQERSYSEEDVKNAFLDGWQLRDGDLPFPKAKKKWFNEFKKK